MTGPPNIEMYKANAGLEILQENPIVGILIITSKAEDGNLDALFQKVASGAETSLVSGVIHGININPEQKQIAVIEGFPSLSVSIAIITLDS